MRINLGSQHFEFGFFNKTFQAGFLGIFFCKVMQADKKIISKNQKAINKNTGTYPVRECSFPILFEIGYSRKYQWYAISCDQQP